MTQLGISRGVEQHDRQSHWLGGSRFDWVFVLGCTWIIVGVFVDVWAHAQGRTDESFFTPYHALMYSGFLATAVFALVTFAQNRMRGFSGWNVLPRGYRLSVIGLIVFGIGGLADMIWHLVYGIEVDFDAIMSPSHLVLAVGIGLVVTGPIRAAWHRRERTPAEPLPLIIALGFSASGLGLFTLYANPFMNLFPLERGYISSLLGTAGAIIQAVILMAVLLLAIKRWRLPFGAFTLYFLLALGGVIFVGGDYELFSVALVTGLVADGLNTLLKPHDNPDWRLRLFAFAVPLVLYIAYHLVVARLGQTYWSVHALTGSIMVSGIVGWLGSYLLWPPAMPELD